MTAPLTVLVLAGQRDGRIDPLAEAAGLDFKALAPVAGRPMIVHVLESLAACGRVGTIRVSINEGAGLERVPEAAALIAGGRLTIVPSRSNLADSVLAALNGAAYPVLITTADSVLLSAASVDEFDDAARAANADVAIALARKASVLAVHPEGQRKFYRCADDSYSNCNTYWLGHARARAPVELFRSGGQFVKYPMRVVKALGLLGVIEIVRFRYGYGTLEGSFRRLSRRFRLKIQPVALTDGAAAIDVDNERSLKVTEQVLAARRTPAAIAAE